MERRDVLMAAAALSTAAPAALDFPAASAASPAEARGVWRDPSRDRDVPVLLRTPAGRGPFPAVLVSHGLGGSREGLAYLGRALAEAGFLAVHLQHPGTDIALWQSGTAGLMAGALDVNAAVDRLRDVAFALGRLPREADPARVGIAGHSFGAWTVQHMLGQCPPGGTRGLTLPDPRLKAGVALSPVPARGLPGRVAYGGIAAPMLSVTGTADTTFVDGATPEDRRKPFEEGTHAGGLAVLAGANHAAFADEAAAGARWSDPTYHDRAAGLAVAFFRATLLGDAEAARFLREGAPGLLARGDALATRGV